VPTVTIDAVTSDAYELRSRIGAAWDRLAADNPFDAYAREKALEDVDRALALAFKLTDIISEVGGELGRNRQPAPKKQSSRMN
jgi:hypothetical protein